MIHKYQIAAMLGRQFGLRTYLEMATPTTGNEYAFVDTAQFPERSRIMYYCPDGWADGLSITHRTPAASSRALRAVIGNERFELVFVDTWHEYDNQVEDRFHFETGGAMSWGIALGPAAPANTSTVPLIAKTFFRTNGASTPDTRDQQCTMDRSGNVTVTWESEPY